MQFPMTIYHKCPRCPQEREYTLQQKPQQKPKRDGGIDGTVFRAIYACPCGLHEITDRAFVPSPQMTMFDMLDGTT